MVDFIEDLAKRLGTTASSMEERITDLSEGDTNIRQGIAKLAKPKVATCIHGGFSGEVKLKR